MYFARSGRTNRGLRCGWKGYAYIQPRCEFDAAKHRIGHGVGMPQTDGAMRADAGATYDQILNVLHGVTMTVCMNNFLYGKV